MTIFRLKRNRFADDRQGTERATFTGDRRHERQCVSLNGRSRQGISAGIPRDAAISNSVGCLNSEADCVLISVEN